jgi:type I restriction enzyme S subunit
MSAYRPYPKYKPSGVEWLGDVPDGWEVVQLKNFVNIQNGADHKHVEQADGYPVMGSGGIFAYASEFLYDGESVLLGRKGTIDKPLHVTGRFWTVDTMYWTKINPSASGRFTYYTALTIPFGYYSTNTALPSMTKGNLASHLVAKPPLPEQHQIAAFLDRECGKLDALQAKQERLIELLKEKRQALISHAVTRGLDPTAKLKPSGIEWLGDVPEHWRVTRLKFHVSRFEQGWSPQCEGRNKEDGEIGVLKVGCVNGGNFRVEEHKALPPELEPRLQYSLKRGDLLISRANTRELVGSAAVVDRDHDDILLCDKLYRLRFHRGVSEIYLSHFLGTSEVRQQIELDATGASASMVNIGQDCIRELNLALPPLAEQRAIVAHLDEKCGKIDQLKAKAERGIELLKERRSALISAAVTGKIDVRQA